MARLELERGQLEAATTVVARCWLVIGVLAVLVGATTGERGLPILGWGVASVTGAWGLLTRRVFGWWVTVALNACAVALFGWACTRAVIAWLVEGNIVFVNIDNGLQLLSPVFLVLFSLALVLLLLDRPSKWQMRPATSTSNR